MLKCKTSKENPASFITSDNQVYAVVGEDCYNIADESLKSEKSPHIESENSDNSVIDAGETLEYDKIADQSSVRSYQIPFTVYYSEPIGTNYCYAYAIANVLMNRMSNITPNNASIIFNSIFNDIISYTGYAQGATITTMANFLFSRNYYCEYRDGYNVYMTFDQVQSAISTLRNYILIGAYSADPLNPTQFSNHIQVITGYYYDGTAVLYMVWNPYYGYVETVNMITDQLALEPSTGRELFNWDNGYLFNIM